MKRTELKRKAPLGAGYDYTAFRESIRFLDGLDCWVASLLAERQDEHPFDYSPGLLTCAGELDGHHLLRKNRLKQEFNGMPDRTPDTPENREFWERPLVSALEDPRNGVLVCRRHHDMLERGLIVVRRAELPARVSEFAEDYGLSGWLDRYFR